MNARWLRSPIANAAATEVPAWYVEPSFARRAAGALIDSLVAAPVLLVHLFADGLAAQATTMTLVAVYVVVFTVRGGQTVGKMVVATRVVDRVSGATIDVSRAIARWLVVVAGALLALAAPAVGDWVFFYDLVVVAPVLSRPLHQGLHDRVAGTVVTVVPSASSVSSD